MNTNINFQHDFFISLFFLCFCFHFFVVWPFDFNDWWLMCDACTTNQPPQQSTPIDTTVFKHLLAEDIDAGVNGLVEYFLVEGNRGITNEDTLTSADGYGTFAIEFPHQGQVTLNKSLDYERIQKYYLTIVASVRVLIILNIFMSDNTIQLIFYSSRIVHATCLNVWPLQRH